MKFTFLALVLFAFQFSFAQSTTPPKALKPVPQKIVDPTGDRGQCIIGTKSDNVITNVTMALNNAEASVKDPKKASPELCKKINQAKAVVKYMENYIAKPNGCKPAQIQEFRAKLNDQKSKLESNLVKQFNCQPDALAAATAPSQNEKGGSTTVSNDPVEIVKNELTRAFVAVTNFHKSGGAYPESLEKVGFESGNANVSVSYKKEGSGFLLKATDGNTQMSIDQNKRLVVK